MFAERFLDGQVAIVTGGGTGLGKSMAARFAELGARLVLASRKQEHLDAASAELTAKGAEVLTVATDVRKPDEVDRMVARTIERFGRVDILLNNAGANFVCPTEALSVNGWNAIVGIVLHGTFYCTLAAGREMIKRKSGKVLSIVANYAWTGHPHVAPSASAKAGVIALTQTLGVEWAKYGIRVNAIAPGPFPTPGAWERLLPTKELQEAALSSVPVRRFGRHEELANLAAYLVSPYADYITGECVVIDGGQWLQRDTLKFASPDEAPPRPTGG